MYYLVLRWLENVSCQPMEPQPYVPGTEGTMATDAGASSDLTRAFPDEPESSAPDQKAKIRLKRERGVGGVLLQVLHRRPGGKVVGE